MPILFPLLEIKCLSNLKQMGVDQNRDFQPLLCTSYPVVAMLLDQLTLHVIQMGRVPANQMFLVINVQAAILIHMVDFQIVLVI